MYRIAAVLTLACVLLSQPAWSVPVTYSVTGTWTSEIIGAIQTPFAGAIATDTIYSAGQTIALSFEYDSSVAGINLPDLALYPGSVTNLTASVGADSLSAALGSTVVNDNGANDLLVINADPGIFNDVPPGARDLVGFSAVDSGGNTWMAANLRFFFIGSDFLSSEALPGSLLGLGSLATRIAVDFWDMAPEFDADGNVINGAVAQLVFFDVTDIGVSVPEPSTLSLLLAGLLGLGFSRRRMPA